MDFLIRGEYILSYIIFTYTSLEFHSLLYLPKSKLLPLTKSLGVHRSPLQITIQTCNNYVRIIMTVIIIYPVQGPLFPAHGFLICNLANLSTIKT